MNTSYNRLPDDFTPGDNDVVIGKGKKYFFHKGEKIGDLTNCIWSPRLSQNIGYALVSSSIPAGETVSGPVRRNVHLLLQ